MAQLDTLTTKQKLAIAALLSERGVKEAAEKAGVGRETLHRWLREPEFSEALKQAELKAIEGATRQLVGLSEQAIEVLRGILDESSIFHPAVAGVKVRAAGLVLDKLIALRQLFELEERIAALESGAKNDTE